MKAPQRNMRSKLLDLLLRHGHSHVKLSRQRFAEVKDVEKYDFKVVRILPASCKEPPSGPFLMVRSYSLDNKDTVGTSRAINQLNQSTV